jgi:hypothetical protein
MALKGGDVLYYVKEILGCYNFSELVLVERVGLKLLGFTLFIIA